MTDLNEKALKPCPFCGKAMMLRGALWPSEGDRDAIIHVEPTDCPLYDFSNDTFDGSIVEVWNRRALTSATPPDVAELIAELADEADLCRNETATDIADLLDRAATALRLSAGGGGNGWISVSDRLPGEQGQDSENVLCFLNGHCDLHDMDCRKGGGWGVRIGFYDGEKQCFRAGGIAREVTHWQPLPLPPASPTVEAGHVE